jgi:hypothetical protein
MGLDQNPRAGFGSEPETHGSTGLGFGSEVWSRGTDLSRSKSSLAA